MTTRISVIPGQHFDAGVSDPGRPPMPAPATESSKRELHDPILEALCRLEPEDPKVRAQRDFLVGERTQANKSAQALIEAELTKAKTTMIEQWEKQKELCRAQEGVIDTLKAELAQVTNDWNKAVEKKDKAGMHVFDAEQRRKQLSHFASAKETAKADAAIEKAEQAFEELEKPEADLRNRRNYLVLTSVPMANKKLNELAAREAELRHIVTGAAYTTDLGIMVPARSPL